MAKASLSPGQPALYSLNADVLEAIWLERLNQKALLRAGKIDFDCASPVVDDYRKLAVVGEEFGEVAKEVLEAVKSKDSKKRLRAELVQIAAVSIAWLESLEAA